MGFKTKNRFWVSLNLSCHLHRGPSSRSVTRSRPPTRAGVDLASNLSQYKAAYVSVRGIELHFSQRVLCQILGILSSPTQESVSSCWGPLCCFVTAITDSHRLGHSLGTWPYLCQSLCHCRSAQIPGACPLLTSSTLSPVPCLFFAMP